MAYYNTIRNPTIFATKSKDMKNFTDLAKTTSWTGAASKWSSKHLFASRVLCSKPESRLPFLEKHIPGDLKDMHPCIGRLIDGPASLHALTSLSEAQIIQDFEPDSLGYVWAALAPLLRAEADALKGDGSAPSTSSRPRREMTPRESDDYVSSDSFQIDRSPKTRPSSASSESSAGYTLELSAPPLEDTTVRLASCFIRCVLNYSQKRDKTSPFVSFRDERLAYSYTAFPDKNVHAIDDGGLRVGVGRGNHLALLEGKRNFQTIIDGAPIVSDELLAQMVGEALTCRRDNSTRRFLPTSVITIVAIRHYMTFFHFEISDQFIRDYEALPLGSGTSDSFLMVDSTIWFNMTIRDHRKKIVSHILALLALTDV